MANCEETTEIWSGGQFELKIFGHQGKKLQNQELGPNLDLTDHFKFEVNSLNMFLRYKFLLYSSPPTYAIISLARNSATRGLFYVVNVLRY